MISAADVKKLRDRTGAGMMECKRALAESEGDMESAVDWLRVRGEQKSTAREGRVAAQGTLGIYVHPGSQRVGVVELNCETDFVARTDDFQNTARDLAMHVVASNPLVVSRDDVPSEVLERERAVLEAQAAEEGKPEAVRVRIVEGRLDKFLREQALLDQPFVKDPERTVGDVVKALSSRVGEKVVVRRFQRFAVGQD